MQLLDPIPTREDIIRAYNLLVGGIEEEASSEDQDRIYGGVVRSAKGKLVEQIVNHLVRIAWQELDGDPNRLAINQVKTYKINIQREYIERLPIEIRQYIFSNLQLHFYRAKVDVHVFIDSQLVLGIECKSYTENAMLKRVLVDFMLLKHSHPNLQCCLFQLESHLGGDYSNPLSTTHFGSPSTHTLMSFFQEVKLHIITILEGERSVKNPIHKEGNFKELKPESLNLAIDKIAQLLSF